LKLKLKLKLQRIIKITKLFSGVQKYIKSFIHLLN